MGGRLSKGRILWADDEVDMLRPHTILLVREGYHVDAVMNGNDALELLERESYDLVLLDEQMPGLRGIDVLSQIRSRGRGIPVVMVTKSQTDDVMHEAIGRRADDYIVKPTSPRQVLSVVTRLLAGPRLRHERIAREFTRRFVELREEIADARSWSEWFGLYSELVDWELGLEQAGESDLRDILHSLQLDVRRGFCDLVAREYQDWTHEGGKQGPVLSVDVMRRFLRPVISNESSCLLVVMDCLRLDQWRVMRPLLEDFFEVEESLYSSILPTATPFSRNAIFSGLFPDELEETRPGWYESGEEEGYNTFEDQLFAAHVRELAGPAVKTHYEKVFTSEQGEDLLTRLPGWLSEPSATALVFAFVDLLTHGRSESRLLWEVAKDAAALRSLSLAWFERSAALEALKLAARRGTTVLLTTDHGSVHCNRPVITYAQRDATANLRYKFGRNLRVEHPAAVLSASDPDDLRLPPRGYQTNYVLCREDYYLVYPTKLREYQSRYRDSFLHGGISPEEMILPAVLLTPRS
ncbi:MAG: bifunctional response regulator/alkaline phosphatase family protein [marine benthic group bacterium]|jgi:CheY-like chemotaxis protein|nr:bifunctional response regulator/alkaline phosphatase family protein [Gemmatimonadota bacterium]MCL7981302.1 bifunctional response regulator/alkaline phosphatase family protein [Gemmatimonadota bacterium]